MIKFSLTVGASVLFGWLFLAIWRWLRRRRSTENLLRRVVDVGFWSNDGVCRYCGQFSVTYDEHHAHCLSKDLIEWAKARGIDPGAEADIFPDEPRGEPRKPLPPERPATAEEIAEAKKRLEQFIESANVLRTAFNQHVVDPVPISDEERARIAAQFAPHDFDVFLKCGRCGHDMRDKLGPTHCPVTPASEAKP